MRITNPSIKSVLQLLSFYMISLCQSDMFPLLLPTFRHNKWWVKRIQGKDLKSTNLSLVPQLNQEIKLRQYLLLLMDNFML